MSEYTAGGRVTGGDAILASGSYTDRRGGSRVSTYPTFAEAIAAAHNMTGDTK